MLYQCFNDKPPPNFMLAYRLAGETIEKNAGVLPKGDGFVPWFRWIVMRPQMLFAHLVFAYRNRVFAVYVDVVNRGAPSFSAAHKKRLLEASAEYNLIPCLFRVVVGAPQVNGIGVYGSSIKAERTGFGLVDVRTGDEVNPAAIADYHPVPMSAWERHSFAIDIVANELIRKKNLDIGNQCSVIGIDPQIWFKDGKGRPCWCIVREWIGFDEHVSRKEDFYHFIDSNPQLRPYDGYFAGVGITTAETAVFRSNGELVPPSKRFGADCPVCRGYAMYAKATGLERIYVA